jgi:hypothetical protein
MLRENLYLSLLEIEQIEGGVTTSSITSTLTDANETLNPDNMSMTEEHDAIVDTISTTNSIDLG